MFLHMITTYSPDEWKQLKDIARTRFEQEIPDDFVPYFVHINDFNLGVENPSLNAPHDLDRCYHGWSLLHPILLDGRVANKIAVIQVDSIDDLQYLHPIQRIVIMPHCRVIL